MRISAPQLYLAPLAGFFSHIFLAHIRNSFDEVQFRRRQTWRSQNRLRNDQAVLWPPVPGWGRFGFSR
ncbi:MAG: WbqC family protein [Desulfobaccales bacterium]